MADADPDTEISQAPGFSRRRGRLLPVSGAVMALMLGLLWTERTPIADRIISGKLADLHLPARYRIVGFDAARVELADVSVGDPAHPDLTVERMQVDTGITGFLPGISRVTLVKPRLVGRVRDGRLSFGSLDRLFQGPSTGPFRLPAMEANIVDGRASIAGGPGPIGVALVGGGGLRDGFAASLSVVAPRLQADGCAGRGGLNARVTISDEILRLAGPLRLEDLSCATGGLRLAHAGLGMDASLGMGSGKLFDRGGATLALDAGPLALDGARFAKLAGEARIAVSDGKVNATYRLGVRDGASRNLRAASLGFDGKLRAPRDLSRLEADGTISGSGLSPGDDVYAAIERAGRAGEGTLAAPLLRQMATALRREASSGHLSGSYALRRVRGKTSIVVPEARLAGAGNVNLLAVSRLAVSLPDGDSSHLGVAGNFITGDAGESDGLPAITGRMRPGPNGEILRLSMEEYRAGKASLAVPRLDLAGVKGGGLALAGQVVASGEVPGGEVRSLTAPLDGALTGNGALSLWHACAPLRFARASVGSLDLGEGELRLCPTEGGSVLSVDGGRMRLAALVPVFDLSGRVDGDSVRLKGDSLKLVMDGKAPGTVQARGLDIAMGQGDSASRYRIADLEGSLGDQPSGRFSGAEVALAPVPFDLGEGSGGWRWSGGALALSDAAFRVSDREKVARFAPLAAQGASLRLADGRISAEAVLREPKSGREVVRVDLAHDLDSGTGHADLSVGGLTFDQKLQPDTLTPLALGAIANANGTVKGTGRIDWKGGNVTSHGRFSTDGLDFAAAVGPVKGVSGEVVFTDLIGLVTAPHQSLKVAAINPGIEVDDGTVHFAMLPGHVLSVEGAEWPFLDGRLTLLPTRLALGASEVRRYELRVEGVDAAKFLTRLEVSNLSATGVFDGRLPLVFDQNGGRVVGGVLTSRPPGGNVSYVGALTYRDLSPMANYAFRALRSLNYREMRIDMDGAIAGEIVTRVGIKGVSQGKGASRNFLTKQVAKLPIQFNVNIRAPFYQLITSFKSLYDSSLVADPRSLGLVSDDGRKASSQTSQPKAPEGTLPSSQPGIQPPVSEHRP